MDAKIITMALEALSSVAGFLPPPISEIAKAGLALADEAVKLADGRDPLSKLEELRAVLRAGVTADLQTKLDQKP